jgi:hypothetical protein
VGNQVCTICGEQKCDGQVWFLVAESHWDDRLKILRWHDELAKRRGIHSACCPAHVQELVTYWMSSGPVDFFLADGGTASAPPNLYRSGLPFIAEPDTRGGREIGELAVDRASVGRALNENPDSLLIILDELRDALERETTGSSTQLESGAGAGSKLMRQA